MSRRSIVVALAFCSAVAQAACEGRVQPPALTTPPTNVAPEEGGFVVTNALVFDGERFREGNVYVRGATIEGFVDEAPRGAEIVDGRGHTLLPGLVDAHTHIGTSTEHLRRFVEHGVTTAVDLFGPPRLVAKLRADETSKESAGRAALVGAGNLATVPKGHGTEYGVPIPTLERPEEARAFVSARRAEGSEILKIVFDTSTNDVGGQENAMPTLGLETVRALVTEGRANGLPVVVHTGGCGDIAKVLEARPDVIAHGCALPPGDPLPGALAASGAYFNPTLAVQLRPCGLEYWIPMVADPEIAARLTEEERARLGKDRHEHDAACSGARLRFVGEAARAGVKLLAGPDAPNRRIPIGASLLAELDLIAQAGVPIEHVLASATSHPARAYRLADRGRIAKGMRADLLLVLGDARASVRAVWHTRKVWRSGALGWARP
ncbi:MAG: amidohydrolase family protein [Deltaproteobacteria bacterium]|nr:amidohydrolase family protein [Deltaproteobacteria bacterium]